MWSAMCDQGVEGWIHDKAWAGTKDLAIYLFGTPTDAHNLTSQGGLQRLSQLSSAYSAHIGSGAEGSSRAIEGRRSHHEPSKAHGGVWATRIKGRVVLPAIQGVVHDRPIKGYPIVIPRGHVSADT